MADVTLTIPCEGGMLDGKTVHKETSEPVIHQTGMAVLRIHQPYPKRKGEKVTERLLTYTEDYDLTVTPEGPVYRCRAPFGGVNVGGQPVERSEGGAYEVWADRDGKLSAAPAAASANGEVAP